MNSKINFIDVEGKKSNDFFNGINSVVWINLDRSKDRREHMEYLLLKLNVVNTRIEAIDGLHETRENIEKIFGIKAKRTLTMCEVCCTLSHLKAISSLRNVNGDYFMICEDDIVFDNIEYLNTDLKTIIKNAPVFDILMLYKNKIWTGDPGVEYLSWKNEILRGNVYDGAVCYIVTKECVSKVSSLRFETINVSDRLIFESLNTVVYKYNICSTLNKESTIHSHHIRAHKAAQENQRNFIEQTKGLFGH